MSKSLKEAIIDAEKYREYQIWFEGVFVPNSRFADDYCDHFVPNTPFEADSWTAWRKKDGFMIREKFCLLCGKTTEIETKKLKEA